MKKTACLPKTKTIMKATRLVKTLICLCICTACVQDAAAQDSRTTAPDKAARAPKKRFAVKIHDAVGLGGAVATSSKIIDVKTGSSSNCFGLDLGYTFWQNATNQIEVNLGVGYRTLNVSPRLHDFRYSYMAGPAADMDHETYIRHYDIRELSQKLAASYLAIPIYLEYRVDIKKWLRFYVDLGAEMNFKSTNSFKGSGDAYVYGVYPQYDDLVIDEPWLNGFGQVSLDGVSYEKSKVAATFVSIMAGVGLEARIYDPLWFNLGVRYNASPANLFLQNRNLPADSQISETTAPVTYTVQDGETVKSLADYFLKSKLSVFSLNLGLTIRF